MPRPQTELQQHQLRQEGEGWRRHGRARLAREAAKQQVQVQEMWHQHHHQETSSSREESPCTLCLCDTRCGRQVGWTVCDGLEADCVRTSRKISLLGHGHAHTHAKTRMRVVTFMDTCSPTGAEALDLLCKWVHVEFEAGADKDKAAGVSHDSSVSGLVKSPPLTQVGATR